MQRIKSKLLSLLLIFSLCIGMVGIINVDTTYAASKKIHLKKTTVSLAKGKTYQQKLIDKKGKTVKATKVKWKSSSTSIARISKKGTITAVKAGNAKMTAKYKGKTYKFTVKVQFAPTMKSVRLEDGYAYVKYKKAAKESDYYLYASINGGKYKVVDKCGPVVDELMCKVTPGKTYAFKVKAKPWNGKFAGGFSGVKKIKVPEEKPVPELTPWEKLHIFIDSSGYVNGNGDKTFSYSVSSSQDVYFINHENSIELVSFMTINSAQFYTTMSLYKSGSNIASPRQIIGSYDLHTNVFLDSYTKSTKLSFLTTETNERPIDDIQNLANSAFRSAMAGWQLGLIYNFNISLSELGFKKY